MSCNSLEDTNFMLCKVPDLKYFLNQRGISCSFERKIELVRLCELARELNLEVLAIDGNADYEVMDTKRRTIVKNGENIIICSPSSIKVWNKDLGSMPNLQPCDVLVYFMTMCSWDNQRLQCYKNDNGFRLYMAGHIDNVTVSDVLQDSYRYIKATCVPETRQTATPYDVWVLIQDNGRVLSGGCTCVADNGTCKHCVALLFAVSDFSIRHQDRGTEVGTDVECVWDKPRKESVPMEVDDIDIRIDTKIPIKKTPTSKNYQAVKNVSTDSVRKELKAICKGTEALLLQTLYDEGDEESDDSEIEYVPTVFEVAKSNPDNVFDAMKEVFDKEAVEKIEQNTKEQSENPEWFKQRRGRITASIFSTILHFKFTDANENYLSKIILGQSRSFNTPSVNFGKMYESVARQMYTTDYKKIHKKSSVETNGLFVDIDNPYLGASPDGVVKCKCCGEGLMEIKCSFMYQNKTPKEACADHHYHVYLNENDEVKLKENSPWYIQIQGQLGVCKRKWCDFVLFTKKGYEVDRIYFDKHIYEQIVRKCKTFYERYIIDALVKMQ